MDRNTRSVLNKINRSLPQELARNTTKVIVDTSEEDMAREMVQRPDMEPEDRKKISVLIDQGAFRRSEEVINDEVVNKIDQRNSRAVARAIRSGKLPDPMTDPYYRKRMQRLAENQRNPKPKKPLVSKEELKKAGRTLRSLYGNSN